MKKIFIITFLLAIFLPQISFAQEISLESEKNVFADKEKFLVSVYLNPSLVSINAVEGVVVYPPSTLSLLEVRDGNSSVNFWVEEPKVSDNGEVSFSGITPGGFSGNKSFLFSMLFEVASPVDGVISVNKIRLLKNDGRGTEVPASLQPFIFSIAKVTDNKWVDKSGRDIEAPESFTPIVASDPSIYDGKYFLVFSTVDKNSGIDHYEVREGIWGEYAVASSPYLIMDQTLSKNLYIVAIDKAGNKRLGEIRAPHPDYRFQKIFFIVIIVLVCIYLIKRKIYSSK